MTKADQIRQLAAKGLTVSEIASAVGVRYQHAYNVLKRDQPLKRSRDMVGVVRKPELTVLTLLNAGFVHACGWRLDSDGHLVRPDQLPRGEGVYAFTKDGKAMYVGVATMGLAKRLYFYAKPGKSQRTSLRLNNILKQELRSNFDIDILVAQPQNLEWNGLPVHGSAGLELGLIKSYELPWNMRSAK